MKPAIFEKMITTVIDKETKQPKPSIDGNIPMYSGVSGTKLEDSMVSASNMRSLNERTNDIISHINDTVHHFTTEEKDRFDADSIALNKHLADAPHHVSASDRANWDAKETPGGAQAKADVVQANLDAHINDYDLHLTVDEKGMLNGGIYNKTEIDNKFAQFSTGLDWKEAVQKRSDLEIVYPDAKDGWTANVLEDNVTYRYTIPKNILEVADEDILVPGFENEHQLVWVEAIGNYMKWDEINKKWVKTLNIGSWVAISANAITKATEDKDGLMSKEDYSKLELIEDHANNYIHPEELKHLSETEKANYLEIYNSLVLGDPKITIDVEGVAKYKYNGIFTPNERQKLSLIEDEANYYVHPDTHPANMIEEDNEHQFITLEQKNSLDNMATKTPASVNMDGLMSKEMYSKLADIEYKANNYIHPVSHPATMITEDENHLFVTATDKEKWNDPELVTIDHKGAMSPEDKIKLDSILLEEIAKITEIEKSIAALANKTLIGTLVFSSAGTRIDHNIGSLDYSINITPISTDRTNPLENVSNIWVECNSNNCVVHATVNDISKNTQFTYLIRAR